MILYLLSHYSVLADRKTLVLYTLSCKLIHQRVLIIQSFQTVIYEHFKCVYMTSVACTEAEMAQSKT